MVKRAIEIVLAVGLIVFCVVAGCNLLVDYNAKGRLYNQVDDIPHNSVGILLGTSPRNPQGGINYYFKNRIDAAEKLYKAGKVDTIIASGGDYRKTEVAGYDEPAAMRDSLMARGVPGEIIKLDYDGTRTLKSIMNAKDVYNLDKVVLISQEGHNARAIYLADKYGLTAIGYNAAPSHLLWPRVKNTLREYLARVKVILDTAL